MSREKVIQAVTLAAGGALADAVRLVGDLDREFVRKRLKHHLEKVDRDRNGAEALWEKLFAPDPLPERVPVEPAHDVRLDETRRGRAEWAPSPRVELPQRLVVENPGPVLQAIDRAPPFEIDLDRVDVAQIFALVAFATLAREPAVRISGTDSRAARFAFAVGMNDVIARQPPKSPGEPRRTVTLRRITGFDEVEPVAREMATLIVPDDEEVRATIKYVLVELFRNALQHSLDPAGGVVAAQRMDAAQQYARPVVQVAVADGGIGILEALKTKHPELKEPAAALEKALRPGISGTFEEGLTGSIQNAGMGLFFIAEMAKLTGGRLLLASRGAALLLREDPRDEDDHKLDLVLPQGVGFPGTLAAFELPLRGVADFDALFAMVKERAKARRPVRAVHHWIRYEAPPPAPPVVRFIVQSFEDTAAAQSFGQRELEPRILRREPILLDFRGMRFCTQSFLHALLFEPLRLAWAKRVPIYVANVEPAVRSGIELLEDYALAG